MYYYKTKDNKTWCALRTPRYNKHKDFVSITEEQWNEHVASLHAPKQPKDN